MERAIHNVWLIITDAIIILLRNIVIRFRLYLAAAVSNGWYLPAIGELYTISFNYNTINLSLKKLSKTQISSDFYWSSSKSDYSDGDNYAWRIRLSDSALGSTAKKNSRSIRCVIAL
ncbi:MAG: DUF1566 domain-containing protein [Alphaproteobacteria bacterium]